MTNQLYYGDNLAVLRESIADESVDLVYLDPPFNSNAGYNVLFKAPAGQKSEAQIEAFEDTWHWTESAARAYEDVIRSRYTDAATMLKAMRSFLGENDMMAYLAMMAARLLELHRVMRPTGSLYLHCDPTASHYLKILLDSIFPGFFRSELIWKRTSAHNSAKRWGPVHDVIMFYSKSDSFTWNTVFQKYDQEYLDAFYRYEGADRRKFRLGDLTGAGIRKGESGTEWRGHNPTGKGRHWAPPRKFPGGENLPSSTLAALDELDRLGRIHWPENNGVPSFKRYLEDMQGMAAQDVIDDIRPLSSRDRERLGYPTQKPLSLLERIISASSNAGDVVLDPFCGCGTTVHAAQKLERQWVGIDITHLAVSLIERRLKDAFPGIQFEVHGTPKDIGGARDLANRDKYQFEWWAVSLVDAVPQGGKKKGMDRGIDGIRWVRTSPKDGDFEKVLVSVKGGENVGAAMVRDLKGTIDREGALGGMFVTLAEPTREMTREAAAAGFFETSFGRHPKIQILTIAGLLAGQKPDLPSPARGEGFRHAAKESGIEKQSALKF
jgi:site-specific DNA-methyltransferase (adenine-specific)